MPLLERLFPRDCGDGGSREQRSPRRCGLLGRRTNPVHGNRSSGFMPCCGSRTAGGTSTEDSLPEFTIPSNDEARLHTNGNAPLRVRHPTRWLVGLRAPFSCCISFVLLVRPRSNEPPDGAQIASGALAILHLYISQGYVMLQESHVLQPPFQQPTWCM